MVGNSRTILHFFLMLLVYNKVFWKGCLPGSQGNLCKVCLGGTGEAVTKRCADNHNERYYGNMGALRFAVIYLHIPELFLCLAVEKEEIKPSLWCHPICRCLVGDVSGKSYGDVAFIEHHNLQANILSKIFKRMF